MADEHEHIGERIFRLRQGLAMTQADLARGICSTAELSQIEANVVRPTNELINQLATRLGSSADYLRHGVHANAADALRTLLAVAEAHAIRGASQQALNLYEHLVTHPDTSRIPDIHQRAMLGRALVLSSIGSHQDADAQLIRLIGRVEQGTRIWAEAHVALSRSMGQSGHAETARRWLQDALQQIEQPKINDRSDVYVILATELLAAHAAHGPGQKRSRESIDDTQSEFDPAEVSLASELVERAGFHPPELQYRIFWQVACLAALNRNVGETIRWANKAHSHASRHDLMGPAVAANRYARLLLSTGHRAAAASALVALNIDRNTSPGRIPREVSAESRILLAQAYMALDKPDQALRISRQLLTNAAKSSPAVRGRALATYGSVLQALGKPRIAVAAYLNEATRYLELAGLSDEAASVRRASGLALHGPSKDAARASMTERRRATTSNAPAPIYQLPATQRAGFSTHLRQRP